MSIFNAHLLQALIIKESSYIFRHMLSIDMIIVWTINDKEIECQNKSRILSFLDMRINLATYMIYKIRCFFYTHRSCVHTKKVYNNNAIFLNGISEKKRLIFLVYTNGFMGLRNVVNA